MKRTELEKDVGNILGVVKNLDYEIPSNSQILKIIFGKLMVVYILQIVFIVMDIINNASIINYHYFDAFVLIMGSNIFFTIIFLMSTYNIVCMKITIGDKVIKQSILLRLIERKVKHYEFSLLLVNVVIGFILLLAGERFVAGLGFSWFITFLFSMLFFQGSMSRYMTPAVVNSLSKVKEIISGSPENTQVDR